MQGVAVIPKNPTVPLTPELFYAQDCGSGNTTANRTKGISLTLLLPERGGLCSVGNIILDSCAEKEGGAKCWSLALEGAETGESCLGEANVEPRAAVPFSLPLAHDPGHKDGLPGD